MKQATNILVIAPAARATATTSVGPSRLADFYELTKPRMNFLIVITTMVGFLLAGRTVRHDWLPLLHALLGTALCAASAAVLNQLLEVKYDALMPRTRNRPLPAGRISSAEALGLGLACGFAGVAYLAITVNTLTAL